MEIATLRNLYREHPNIRKIEKWFSFKHGKHLLIQQLHASARYVALANLFLHTKKHLLILLDNAEDASYCYGDMCTLLSADDVFLFPVNDKYKVEDFKSTKSK
jgi:transcription-repair coupling factor (superfamily II helicase)